MKKLYKIMIVAIMLFSVVSLTGCNNNLSNTQEQNNSYSTSRINTNDTSNINNFETIYFFVLYKSKLSFI